MELLDNISKWFDEHHTIRKTLLYSVYGGIVYGAVYLQAIPEVQASFWLVVLALLHNWAKHNIEMLGSEKATGKKKK